MIVRVRVGNGGIYDAYGISHKGGKRSYSLLVHACSHLIFP